MDDRERLEMDLLLMGFSERFASNMSRKLTERGWRRQDEGVADRQAKGLRQFHAAEMLHKRLLEEVTAPFVGSGDTGFMDNLMSWCLQMVDDLYSIDDYRALSGGREAEAGEEWVTMENMCECAGVDDWFVLTDFAHRLPHKVGCHHCLHTPSPEPQTGEELSPLQKRYATLEFREAFAKECCDEADTLRAKLAAAEVRSEYNHAEHMAANTEIAALQPLAQKQREIVEEYRDSAQEAWPVHAADYSAILAAFDALSTEGET